MSEISEKAAKLIKDLRRDISIDVMFTPEKNAEDDSLKALMDYIAELESAQRWIPVSERLPEDDVEVVGLYDSDHYYRLTIAVHYSAEGVWTEDDKVLRRGAVTHWMPLPSAPESEDK